MDRIIRFNSERGLLNFDPHSHECYLTAIRQALGLEAIISPPFAAQLSRGLRASPEMQTWSENSAWINTPHADGGECTLFTSSFPSIEFSTVSQEVGREVLQPYSINTYSLTSSGYGSHNHRRKAGPSIFQSQPAVDSAPLISFQSHRHEASTNCLNREGEGNAQLQELQNLCPQVALEGFENTCFANAFQGNTMMQDKQRQCQPLARDYPIAIGESNVSTPSAPQLYIQSRYATSPAALGLQENTLQQLIPGSNDDNGIVGDRDVV